MLSWTRTISWLVLAGVLVGATLGSAGAQSDTGPGDGAQRAASVVADTLYVVPGEGPVTAGPFQVNHSYAVTVSGRLTATRQSGTRCSYVVGAFYVLDDGDNCALSGESSYGQYFRLLDYDTRANVSFQSLKQGVSVTDRIPFDPNGVHEWVFNAFQKPTTLEFSPPQDSSDVRHSAPDGQGLVFDIVELDRIVDFQLDVVAEPIHSVSEETISNVVKTKGRFELVDDGNDDDGETMKGKLALVSVNEGKDHLVVFKLGKGTLDQTSKGRSLTIDAKVTRSNDRGCRKGDKAELQLHDRRNDLAAVYAAACEYGFVWSQKRGSEEFELRITEPTHVATPVPDPPARPGSGAIAQ